MYLEKLAFRIHMHAIQYVRYLCETSDISMEFWYVSHRYLTSWMVLSTPLQLSKMPDRSELPDPGFALKEIAGLSENVSASCNHAQHRIWRYNVWIWIKYSSIAESATKQHKNFEICEKKIWGYQNSSLGQAAVEDLKLNPMNVMMYMGDPELQPLVQAAFKKLGFGGPAA